MCEAKVLVEWFSVAPSRARRPVGHVERAAPGKWPDRSTRRRQVVLAARGGIAPAPSTPSYLVAVALAIAARPAVTSAATTPAAAVATRPLLLALAGRCVLGPLDQLLGADRRAVLVLLDQLEADPAARLVDLLDEHVEDVAALDHVLDVADAAGAHVRDVEQPVGPLLELDERAELRRLHDLAGVGVPHLRLLRQRLDRRDRGLRLRAVGRVDQDRAVLLDVDLDVVVGLERADRLATLADHHPDLLRIDLDGGDPRRVLGELRPRLGDRLEHPVEDELARPLRLLERASHDLLRDAGDLDVHLEGRDALARPGDLEVHVAEVILRSLDVGEDDVVVALLHEAHGYAAHRRL